MPRIIEETWMGIGFDATTGQSQKLDPKDGKPLFDGKGLPRMEEITTLVLIVPLPDGQRVVKVPFNAESKALLVQKLTHGLVVPNGTDPHLPFGKGV